MKKTTIKTLLTLTIFGLNFSTLLSQPCNFEKDELILEFESTATQTAINTKMADYNGIVKESITSLGLNIHLVEFGPFPVALKIRGVGDFEFENIGDLLDHFECDGLINGVGQTKKPKPTATDYNYNTGNRSLISATSHSYNIEDYNPIPDCQTDYLNEAVFRDQATFAKPVNVAVIDAGISSNNSNLIDIRGSYDFIENDNIPNDNSNSRHGEKVTSMFEGLIYGKAPNIVIEPIKVLGENGEGTLFGLYQATALAISNGANVVNMSLGALFCEDDICTIILESILAKGSNTLFVAAAGNDGENIDVNYFHMPGSVQAPNLLIVGSSDCQNQVSLFSNKGRNSVDFFMSGKDVLVLGDEQVDGTSFAAPQAGAIAALVGASLPRFDVETVKCALFAGVQDLGWDADCKAGGVLNPEMVFDNMRCGNASPRQSSNPLTNLPIASTTLLSRFSVGGNLQITIESNMEEEAQINLYASSGRLVNSQSQALLEGQNNIDWYDYQSLPSGIYLVELRTANGVITQKCFKPRN